MLASKYNDFKKELVNKKNENNHFMISTFIENNKKLTKKEKIELERFFAPAFIITHGVAKVIEKFYNKTIEENFLIENYYNLYFYIKHNIIYSDEIYYSEDKTKEEKIEDLKKCKITELGKNLYERGTK